MHLFKKRDVFLHIINLKITHVKKYNSSSSYNAICS